MNSIRAVVFDLDGTIIDSRQAIYLQMKDWFQRYQLEPPSYREILDRVHRTDLRGMLLDLLPSCSLDESFVESAVREIDRSYAGFYMPRYATEITGAIDLVKILKNRRYKVAIVTNATRPMLDSFLWSFGLCDAVDIAVSANEVSNPKPDPCGIRKVLKYVSVEPENALYVGDTTTDILAGKAADVPTVGVLSGIGSREELTNAGAKFVIERVDHLVHIL